MRKALVVEPTLYFLIFKASFDQGTIRFAPLCASSFLLFQRLLKLFNHERYGLNSIVLFEKNNKCLSKAHLVQTVFVLIQTFSIFSVSFSTSNIFGKFQSRITRVYSFCPFYQKQIWSNLHWVLQYIFQTLKEI